VRAISARTHFAAFFTATVWKQVGIELGFACFVAVAQADRLTVETALAIGATPCTRFLCDKRRTPLANAAYVEQCEATNAMPDGRLTLDHFETNQTFVAVLCELAHHFNCKIRMSIAVNEPSWLES
jgi:hypothetical protein